MVAWPRLMAGVFGVVGVVVVGCNGAVIPPPAPPAALPATAPTVGVTRLTPEQVRETLRRSLKTDYGITDAATGETISYITEFLALPLGGVDFLGRIRDRDALTKVQTLLAVRSIAWPVAVGLVDRELQVPPSPDRLFTACDVLVDSPTGDAASRARWEAQLQSLYLRLYSRPATVDEVALVATTFDRVAVREGNTASAWLVTLYALLSSMETWNTWR